MLESQPISNIEKKEQILIDLSTFTGSEHFKKHMFGLHYSEGMAYVADEFGAFWLLDVIGSYLPKVSRYAKMKECGTFICRLNKRKDESWKFEILDGDKKQIIKQIISFSDFPLDSFECWLGWNEFGWTAFLPSEY